MKKTKFLSLAIVLSWLTSLSAGAETEADHVLVLVNRTSPISQRLAAYYQKKRAIAANHLFMVNLPDSNVSPTQETITYAVYQKYLQQPLISYLKAHKLTDSIRYLVLTKGVPLRVIDVPYAIPTLKKLYRQSQSVDSTLAALGYQTQPYALRAGKELLGMMRPNLYWRQDFLFEHRLTGGYLVTRLDGYTESDARALVDRALVARSRLEGLVLLDPARQDSGSGKPQPVDIFDPLSCNLLVFPNCQVVLRNYENGDFNDDLRLTYRTLPQNFAQVQTLLAPPANFLTGQNIMGYASWGSNDENFTLENYQDLRFRPGAIAETAVSTSARTFLPTQGGQSLIADLVKGDQGVTGIRGYSDEPYLITVGSPSVLLLSYFGGANLATAYYQSIRFVGWRDIVLGDPLALAVNR